METPRSGSRNCRVGREFAPALDAQAANQETISITSAREVQVLGAPVGVGRETRKTRDGLICELLFAVKAYVDSHVDAYVGVETARCRECGCPVRPDGQAYVCSEHAAWCPTGRFANLLAQILVTEDARGDGAARPCAAAPAPMDIEKRTPATREAAEQRTELPLLGFEMVTPRLAEIVAVDGGYPVATMHGDPDTGLKRAREICAMVDFFRWFRIAYFTARAKETRVTDAEILSALFDVEEAVAGAHSHKGRGVGGER